MLERAFVSILSTDLPRSQAWYQSLFGYRIEFESDWFIHLQDPDNPALELGLIAVDHEIVTDRMRASPTGGLITLVVADVDRIEDQATTMGVEILQPPTNLFYGQRRMLLADPDGQVVDVSSECDPDPDWVASLTGS